MAGRSEGTPRSSEGTPRSAEGTRRSAEGTPPGGRPVQAGPLDWTHRLFGGLVHDIHRRAPYKASDWADAFRVDNFGTVVAAVLSLFFTVLAPAISFGKFYEKKTDGELGALETFLSTAINGVVYAALAGQPITILSTTAPVFAYTVVCKELSKTMGLEFLPFYFWTLMWCSLFTVVVVMFDLCALMQHVTRFTEDVKSGLISLIFIVEAVRPAIEKFTTADRSVDAALLELLLMLATYKGATELTNFRRTPWFTVEVRAALSKFGVFISIAGASAIQSLWPTIEIEMLDASSLKLDTSRRWIVHPLGAHGDFPVWGILFSTALSVGFTVLGFLDQTMTTMLVNQPGRKLLKPPAYHLDLLVWGIFCTPICAVFGLPLVVGSPVPSLTHVMSLTTYTVETLPHGKRRVPVKVCEQRVTNALIHVLLGTSLFFAPMLKYVPKAVLSGVFLYMGVAFLDGNELFDRLLLWGIWEIDEFPQLERPAEVRSQYVHLYTLLQAVCLAVLYGLKVVKQTAVMFPVFMAFLVVIRKSFKWVFTEAELEWLDGEGEVGDAEEVWEHMLGPSPAKMASMMPTGPGLKSPVWQRSYSEDVHSDRAESVKDHHRERRWSFQDVQILSARRRSSLASSQEILDLTGQRSRSAAMLARSRSLMDVEERSRTLLERSRSPAESGMSEGTSRSLVDSEENSHVGDLAEEHSRPMVAETRRSLPDSEENCCSESKDPSRNLAEEQSRSVVAELSGGFSDIQELRKAVDEQREHGLTEMQLAQEKKIVHL